ncbi:MAG: Fe-S cluster assembly scaffold protein NifU [Ruminococcaceae bacterium]|nr:Fe-S cluster assembly scaffold protein NifU [Oscillospiraceae bacterium]MBQ8897366.1 Fe-S cluster assembly scaffold protein NifU [Clostridia bacterium]
MYSEKVMDHFTHPRNVGVIEDANAVGQVGNMKCGDIMKIYMKIENEIITDVKFQTFGCGAAVATSSMATELVKGQSINDALKLTNSAVVEALEGLPPVKIHCSVLAEEAVKSAIADYYRRQGIDPEPIVGCTGDCEACHAHDHGNEE